MNVMTKKEEPLLSRTMLKASLDYERATPSYKDVVALLASHLKTDEKLIVIRHIYNAFGAKKAEVIAYVYSDENKKQLIEPKVKEKKEKKVKEAPKKQ
jgi:ribosomal protein S24E